MGKGNFVQKSSRISTISTKSRRGYFVHLPYRLTEEGSCLPFSAPSLSYCGILLHAKCTIIIATSMQIGWHLATAGLLCVFFLFHIFFILCTYLYAVHHHLPCDRRIKITNTYNSASYSTCKTFPVQRPRPAQDLKVTTAPLWSPYSTTSTLIIKSPQAKILLKADRCFSLTYYTQWTRKKRDILFLIITLANFNRFL